MRRLALFLFAAFLTFSAAASSDAWAQRACTATAANCPNQTVTTSKIQLGGAGSLSSNGNSFSNPGRLDDGTIAEADYNFSFDRSSGQLTLVVTNQTTSTATLTGMSFNVTSDVTGMSLVSHTGTLPWELAFDLDRNDNVVDTHPSLKVLKMDGFGAFFVLIANKGIDTGPGGGDPTELLAGGSITFVIQVSGNISSITACSFTSVPSLIPPGDKIVTAVARFQSGVQGGSGFIGPCTGGSLLITLSSFDVEPGDGRVRVKWTTASELDNAGFAIIRRDLRAGVVERLNQPLIVPQGSPVSGADYEFVDTTALNGVKHRYQLEDFDLDGFNTLHAPKVAIANPVRPPIRLVAPAYEEQAGNVVSMRWEADKRVAATLEISGDPSFPLGSTLQIAVGAGNTRRLSPRELDETRSLAGMGGEGGVYWRVTGRRDSGDLVRSDVFFLAVGP